jgi:acyl transferase domain-containing protein
MASSTDQLKKAWQRANEHVRSAEERLAHAWAAFAAGTGGPPDKELLTEVARLRRECDQHLAALLDGFRSKDSVHRKGGPERPTS